MASPAAQKVTDQPHECKRGSSARSRSTSAGSSTQASSGSDLQSPTPAPLDCLKAVMAPPGLEGFSGNCRLLQGSRDALDSFSDEHDTALQRNSGLRPPPGLEDIVPVAMDTKLLQDFVPLTLPQGPSLTMLPPPPLLHAPLSFMALSPLMAPPFMGSPFMAPSFMAPPSMASPFMGAPPFMAPPLLQPPPLFPVMDAGANLLTSQLPLVQPLPPPPALPPVLNACTDVLTPPPPLSSVTLVPSLASSQRQPPPTQAPILHKELLTPSIPQPPTEAPVLHVIEKQAILLELDALSLPSIGSAEHHLGTCIPCAFVYAKGCTNGAQCSYCHTCEPGEKKRRMKEKRALLRAANQRGD